MRTAAVLIGLSVSGVCSGGEKTYDVVVYGGTSGGVAAAVQTATTLPILLLALPAGALADLVDRRRLIIVGQSLLAVIASVFATLVLVAQIQPWMLLLYAFLLGVGHAFYGPTRNAVVPRLVPREQLRAAIVLNGVGVNLARAAGPPARSRARGGGFCFFLFLFGRAGCCSRVFCGGVGLLCFCVWCGMVFVYGVVAS